MLLETTLAMGTVFAAGAIVWVVVGLVVVVVAAVIVSSVTRGLKRAKRKIQREITNSVTSQIIKTVAGPMNRGDINMSGIMKQAVTESMEEQPKSVSGATSLMLPRIIRDFPDFEYDEMRERTKLLLKSYLDAITQNNADILTDAGDEIKQNVRNIISDLENNRQSRHFDSIKIHQTEIKNYNKTAGRCVITFDLSVEYYDYTTDTAGNIIAGSKTSKHQSRYNIDLIYVQDREIVEQSGSNAIGINCPNCGAPLSMLGAKTCSYCGTGVVDINLRAWTYNRVKEFVR